MTRWLTIGLIVCLLLSACGLAEAGHRETVKIIKANNAFAFRLYAELAKKDATQNLFFSPVSINMALAMSYNGAQGPTKTQMAKTCGWYGLSLGQLNSSYTTLSNLLQQRDDTKISVSLANSVWLNSKSAFKPDYLQRVKQAYHAELAQVTFTDPATVTRINQWVSAQTKGNIPEIARPEDFHANTKLALLNAVYFQAAWQTPFQAAETEDGTFHHPDGTASTVHMMHRSGTFAYYGDMPEGPTAPRHHVRKPVQIVKLPYGQGGMSMVIVLPAAGSNLTTLRKSLTPATWRRWMIALTPTKGNLALPRFTADYTIDLATPLAKLGLPKAFTAQADFSGMSDTKNRIGLIRHKATLAVDEQGTVAAAVTQHVCTLSIAYDEFIMTVDRPFLFAIRDEHTGAILFMGTIVDPQ